MDKIAEELRAFARTMKKQAFTPFPENQVPPILMSPDGQPFIVDPETSQVMPATPEQLAEMGIDPAQFGMGPEGGPQGGPPPQGGMPPAGPQGGPPPQQGGMPPQQGGGQPPNPEEILMQHEDRLGQIEQALDSLMQMLEGPQQPPQQQR